MTSHDHKLSLNAIPFTVFGIAALLWLLTLLVIFHPYFWYGNASATGWYDEFDLPMALQGVVSNGRTLYAPEFAGGTYVAHAFSPFGNPSFLSLMISAFGEWLSYAIFRIIWPLLGGWFILHYLSTTCGFQNNSKNSMSLGVLTSALLLVVGLATITLVTPAVFGWTPGMGPNVYLCLTLAIVLADKRTLSGRPSLYWFVLIIAGFLQSNTLGSLTVFLPAFFVLSACLWIYTDKKRGLAAVILGALVVALATIFFSIGELQILLHFSSSENYSRFSKIVDDIGFHHLLRDVPINQMLQMLFGDFAFGSMSPFDVNLPRRFANSIWFVLFGFGIMALCVFWTRRPNAIASTILMIVATPVVATTVYILGIMEPYRFQPITMVLVHGFMLIVLIEVCRAATSSINDRESKFQIGRRYFSFFFMIVFGWLSFTSFFNFNLRTYGDVIFHGETWNRYINQTDERFDQGFRALSITPYQPRPEFGLRLGLEMFDGMRQNFTIARTNFFFYSLANEPVPPHTHRHTVAGWDISNVDVNMLRLANVKYLLSFYPIAHKFDLSIPVNSCTDRFPCNVAAKILGPPRLYEKLYVQELENPWPRVFQPLSAIQSTFSYKDISYFRDLKSVPTCSVLLPKELTSTSLGDFSKASFGNKCHHLKYVFDGRTLNINGVQSGRPVVVNHEYVEGMKAYCDAKEIFVHPVNGIQLLLPVHNLACNSVKLLFKE